MEIKINFPKEIVQTNTKTRYNPRIDNKDSTHVDVFRVEMSEKHTRIDFLYAPDTIKYKRGWWVCIHKTIFIRPSSSDIKLGLLSAVNIPIAPKKYYHKNAKDIKAFTLFFPALPKETSRIDIIESLSRGDTWFNFYGVELNTSFVEGFVSLSAFGNN